MIDAFRVFSPFTTGAYTFAVSGRLPLVDDRIIKRDIKAEPIDISQIPDLSEIKSYEDG